MKGVLTMTLRIGLRIGSLAGAALLLATAAAAEPAPVWVDQGRGWSGGARWDYYSRDQGSRIIPWKWIGALKQADGRPFLADSLTRYGYLPNERSPTPGLPVGFLVAKDKYGENLAVNCAACHTRQIEVDGKAYRIDGGPAIADLGAFWADLDAAANRLRTDPAAFAEFARAVNGPSTTPEKDAALKEAFETWFAQFDAITQEGLLKAKPWGLGRMDAVGMIFNRVTGLDIGPPPSFILRANMKPADAPVRPPFLWNAPIQDRTQWPGFAENGNSILALSRNLGQVFGVFGVFHPNKDDTHPLGFDYVSDNSGNFQGLLALERLVERIGPPRWPWPVDAKLAQEGEKIYSWRKDEGGCVECHGKWVNPNGTWATPVTPLAEIGTDVREIVNLGRVVSTGALTGASIPFLMDPLKATDAAANVLGVAVRGSILQYYFPGIRVDPKLRTGLVDLFAKVDGALPLLRPLVQQQVKKTLSDLRGAYPQPATALKPAPGYEARVLEGVWAAAPYLHNGSVPSLAELLKPAKDRVASFAVGPAYDPVNVGLAATQTKFNRIQPTTGCEDVKSGDSRCGHEFGTRLTPDQKKALLEYLKTL
jgi:mono/diheme cytochrome c family protein